MVDRRRRPHRTPNKLYHRVRKLMEVRSACGCTPRVKCGALAGFSAYISRHRLALALEKIQWTCYQDTTQLYYLHGGAWSQLGGVICGSYTCVTCVACVTCRLQQPTWPIMPLLPRYCVEYAHTMLWLQQHSLRKS